MEALRQVDGWPCRNAAVAVVYPDGAGSTHGDAEQAFDWASVTKLATAVAVLVAVEEGIVDARRAGRPARLDGAAPARACLGAAVRRQTPRSRASPSAGSTRTRASRRSLDTSGRAGDAVRGVLRGRLGLPARRLAGPRAWLRRSPRSSRSRCELSIAAADLAGRRSRSRGRLQFPGLAGVLPGFGRFEPNDWGLGFELRDGKRPHWTGTATVAATFGHFGRAGGFLWVDPEPGIALACLTDLDFGDWAKEAWPRLADAVLAEL